MKLEPIPKDGTTLTRKAFWDKVAEVVNASQKKPGKNVSVDVHDGYGSVINVNPQRGGSSTPTGACCRGTTCTVETQASCESDGGIYQGDGTVCDPNPCCGPPVNSFAINVAMDIAVDADCPDPTCEAWTAHFELSRTFTRVSDCAGQDDDKFVLADCCSSLEYCGATGLTIPTTDIQSQLGCTRTGSPSTADARIVASPGGLYTFVAHINVDATCDGNCAFESIAFTGGEITIVGPSWNCETGTYEFSHSDSAHGGCMRYDATITIIVS